MGPGDTHRGEIDTLRRDRDGPSKQRSRTSDNSDEPRRFSSPLGSLAWRIRETNPTFAPATRASGHAADRRRTPTADARIRTRRRRAASRRGNDPPPFPLPSLSPLSLESSPGVYPCWLARSLKSLGVSVQKIEMSVGWLVGWLMYTCCNGKFSLSRSLLYCSFFSRCKTIQNYVHLSKLQSERMSG